MRDLYRLYFVYYKPNITTSTPNAMAEPDSVQPNPYCCCYPDVELSSLEMEAPEYLKLLTSLSHMPFM